MSQDPLETAALIDESDATTDTVLALLQSMYWEGVQREICNMVLALKELSNLQPEPLPQEASATRLESQPFNNIFNLWSPQHKDPSMFDYKSAYRTTVQAAQARISENLEGRRARAMLQASGILDIDLVHEKTLDTIIRRHQHNPQSQRKFERELDRRHDASVKGPKGQFQRLAAKVLDPSHTVAAGPLHFTVMFGPLLFENGASPSRPEASITSRPIPSFRYDNSTSLLYGTTGRATGANKVLAGYLYQRHDDSSRVLSKESKDHDNQRQFLACNKRILGGAFSGHNSHWQQNEADIVQLLVKTSKGFGYIPSKSVLSNRCRLSNACKPIVGLIKDAFGHEVDLHLKRFSSRLMDNSVKLKWDLQLNNCQTFAVNLISDKIFNGLFHPIPRNFVTEERVRLAQNYPMPRYLLSFGTSIDTPIALLRPQARSLIWKFYHRKRDDCDIIEFGQNAAMQKEPELASSWQLLCSVMIDSHSHGPVMVPSETLWELPRDSISILQTHILRKQERYSSTSGYALSKMEWIENRLSVLNSINSFLSLAGSMGATDMKIMTENFSVLEDTWFPDAERKKHEMVAGEDG
ncbi:uncharacterized protein K452DRAFT_296543 [Aplosporella prunicola CBS 121167]|uniref:Uncharacterized protein n=1 Tax=Aplosporella prunicola CBS 121167 TaxID=1176127 RepID=A0A6A6BJQ4_9PEZI|nr:uncharacterized protein K452DRAFT_296543 [Aplosporella prunicola CBS 121167]KAF2144352.1 hypothetical protein K452DRAFT_296543 [Aplosporella prunicola CBS 121167]